MASFPLLVVRHGTSCGNLQRTKRTVPYEDPELTRQGRLEAIRRAAPFQAALQMYDFTDPIILVSPLRRTQETAQLMLGIPPSAYTVAPYQTESLPRYTRKASRKGSSMHSRSPAKFIRWLIRRESKPGSPRCSPLQKSDEPRPVILFTHKGFVRALASRPTLDVPNYDAHLFVVNPDRHRPLTYRKPIPYAPPFRVNRKRECGGEGTGCRIEVCTAAEKTPHRRTRRLARK